jgi:hypothetical protein
VNLPLSVFREDKADDKDDVPIHDWEGSEEEREFCARFLPRLKSVVSSSQDIKSI